MNVAIYPGRGTSPDWNNPDILERQMLPPHASFVPFPDSVSCKHALADHRRYLSPHVLSLRGDWDFRMYPSVLQLPENILSFRSGFEKRPVPEESCICPELKPVDSLPFPVDPPLVHDEQPVFVYRKTCQLPVLWGRCRKRIVLQGVRSACHVFVNGKCAGYGQGSGLPADFDITLLLHDGDNEIFLIIYPYHVGSYLEEQPDQPWFGCIRDVYLEAHPTLTLHDLHIQTTWVDQEQAWRLDLSAVLLSYRIAIEQPTVHASLYDANQSIYEAGWSVVMKPVEPDRYPAPVQTAGVLRASLLIRDIRPWSDEDPVLYDLFVSVHDQHGHDQICLQQAVGFRQLDWHDECLSVNQRPVRLKAIRWSLASQVDPTADLPQLITQLKRYKRSHLNAIWFCDVPPDPIMLDLCDIYGFYVIEDAPLQASPSWVRGLSKKRQSLPEKWMFDRLNRLIIRDRNHPSIIAWSCGLFLDIDRSDSMMALLADRLLDQVRKLDTSRLIHGIDFSHLGRHLDNWLLSQDLTRLADISWIRLPDAHEQPWCIFDHALPQELLPPLAKQIEPIVIEPINPIIGSFNIRNRLSRVKADCFKFNWSLIRNGQPVLAGALDGVVAEPGHSQMIELWYGDIDFSDGADYLIRWTVSANQYFFWYEPDEELSIQEHMLQIADSPIPRTQHQGGRLRLESDRHHLIVSGSRFWFVFNRIHATLESWRTGDREWLAPRRLTLSGSDMMRHPPLAGLRCSLIRQPEPVDEPDWVRWSEAGFDRLMTQVISVEDGCDGKNAVIEMTTHIGAAGVEPYYAMNVRYEISAQGALRLFASLTPLRTGILPPPCFSFCLNPARSLQQVSWFGLGPERSISRLIPVKPCSDHYEAALRHLCRADAEPGVFRQIRKLTLRDPDGLGLMIQSDHLFAFNIFNQDLTERIRVFKNQPMTEDIVLQLIHQDSLKAQPLDEPLKFIADLKPII